MRRIRTMPFVAIIALAVGCFCTAQAQVLAPHSSGDPVVLASETDASYNWAGYVAEGHTYTAVSARWVVPAVEPGGQGADLAADATWVGIGGVGTRDLIQAGTQAIVDSDSTVIYQAWWEALPDTSQPLPLRVRPGDTVSASVTYAGSGLWHVVMVNITTGMHAEVTVAYDSSFGSAEWVEEAPSLALSAAWPIIPLSNFGVVTFSRASAMQDGAVVTLADTGAEPLRMVAHSGAPLAAPSVLSGGSFSVVRSGSSVAASAQPTPRSRTAFLQISL